MNGIFGTANGACRFAAALMVELPLVEVRYESGAVDSGVIVQAANGRIAKHQNDFRTKH